jgi:uncharacterized protein (DUF2147 family)
VKHLMRLVLIGLAGVAALAMAGTAAALPANPWTGTWQTNDGGIATITQTGTQISGTQLCPGTTSLPGITYSGTASADNRTANFSYQSSVCTGVGGTFTGTLQNDGRRIEGSGVTQFGTGFSFSWTYQGGGTEPRETPVAPPPAPRCAGGPWSGLWSAQGSSVFSFAQSGNQLSGTLVNEPETVSGTISGNTANATFRVPEGTGTFRMTLAPDGNSFSVTGTTTTGRPFGPETSTFLGCSTGLAGVDLRNAIPAPQTLQGGPTTIVAPGTVSLTSLTRSKCVLVKVASSRPARILVSIFSGRRSIRLFGQRRVVFTAPGRQRVCIPVPFRAHTFNLRTRLNVALGYVVGATSKRGEKKPPPVIRRIKLVP